MRYPDARILIFTKAPVAGEVKTRLTPELSPEDATHLHANMIRHTLETVCQSKLAPTMLYCHPDTQHPLFQSLHQQWSIPLAPQHGNDLGERMYHAITDNLMNQGPVLLIGTDCPLLDAAYLESALEALHNGNDVVLGPAEDGGYILIGTRRSHKSIFTNIPWGTNQVMKKTRDRMQQLGWHWQELDTLWDVDRPEDVVRLQKETGSFGHMQDITGLVQDKIPERLRHR